MPAALQLQRQVPDDDFTAAVILQMRVGDKNLHVLLSIQVPFMGVKRLNSILSRTPPICSFGLQSKTSLEFLFSD